MFSVSPVIYLCILTGLTWDSWLLFAPSYQLWRWWRAMHVFRHWWRGDQTIWDFCVSVPEFPLTSLWEQKADGTGAEPKIPPLALDRSTGQHRSVCLWRYSLHRTLPLSRPVIATRKDVFEPRNHCTFIWEFRKEERMGQDLDAGAV